MQSQNFLSLEKKEKKTRASFIRRKKTRLCRLVRFRLVLTPQLPAPTGFRLRQFHFLRCHLRCYHHSRLGEDVIHGMLLDELLLDSLQLFKAFLFLTGNLKGKALQTILRDHASRAPLQQEHIPHCRVSRFAELSAILTTIDRVQFLLEVQA